MVLLSVQDDDNESVYYHHHMLMITHGNIHLHFSYFFLIKESAFFISLNDTPSIIIVNKHCKIQIF